MQAVILAGGQGTRLYPYTITLPKPLVPVGDQAILEILIKQLVKAGVTEIVLSVNHKAPIIMAYFGDGDKYGVSIRYVIEDHPLGTAGPLSIIPGLEENFLVINGDILTTLDFHQLFRIHDTFQNNVTVGLFQKQVKIDLGVVDVDKDRIVGYTEKPTFTYLVSMGAYAMNRYVVQLLKRGEHFDLPNLVMLAKDRGMQVRGFIGSKDTIWLDIGRPEDYALATETFLKNRGLFP